MNKGVAILAAAALFASGLAIGALSVHLFYSQKVVRSAGPPMPIGPMFERWVLGRLDLSEEQRHEVEEILDRSRAEAEELRRDVGPRLMAMNRETVEAISEILTDEQRERLEELLERQERRRRPRGRRGRGPGPGPGPDRRP